MCFYDNFSMSCGCAKWGHFRQHCAKEYRTGETCGMKLVMTTIPKSEKCKTCQKIDTKMRAQAKKEDDIRRWRRESNRSASISKAVDDITHLKYEIECLMYERDTKKREL